MKRATTILAGLAVAVTLVGGPSLSPVAADGQVPRTLFIADAEPGVPLLANDVAVVEGPGTAILAATIHGRELAVQARDLVHDVTWFVRLSTIPAGSLGPGTWTGMWQSGTYGETTYLTVSGGPFSQGCQRSSSTFTVHELEVAQDGGVATLALSFVWHCDGAYPAVFGEVRVNSTVPVAALRADRTRVGFEPVAAGATAPDQVVSLENHGSVDLRPTVRLTGLGVDAFTIAADACTGTTVAPAEACSITVRYAPVHAGPTQAFLEITDGTRRGVRTVDLEGTTEP